MRALVTGLGGTLGPVVAAALEARGWSVSGWDRALHPPTDARGNLAFLEASAPKAILHLALGPEHWPARLARWAAEKGVPFVFTSSAMVFDRVPDGPHRVGDEPNAKDDYGRYKARCEDAILASSPGALVARIGWQIGRSRGGNQMLEALYRMSEVTGTVRASTAWRPACSFMEDTAESLLDLMDAGASGIYHVDSNAQDGLTFFDVASRLGQRHEAGWRVVPTQDYAHDQRLPDERIAVPALSDRLPG